MITKEIIQDLRRKAAKEYEDKLSAIRTVERMLDSSSPSEPEQPFAIDLIRQWILKHGDADFTLAKIYDDFQGRDGIPILILGRGAPVPETAEERRAVEDFLDEIFAGGNDGKPPTNTWFD